MPNFNFAPSTKNSERTADTPVLVERTKKYLDDPGRIEVWRDTGERGLRESRAGKLAEFALVISQEVDESDNPLFHKLVPVRKIDVEYQSKLARELASDTTVEVKIETNDSRHEKDIVVESEREPKASASYERILGSEKLLALFGPKERPSDAEAQYDYAVVIPPNGEDNEKDFQVEQERVEGVRKRQKDYDRFHTPEAREYSQVVIEGLKYTDPALDVMLREMGGGGSADIVSELSKDANKRYLVAAYLMDKLDFMANRPDMPDRVARNNPNNLKRPDTGNLPHDRYKSREYAVYLALEMLSGGYSYEASRRDPVRTEPGGDKVTQGQHRAAAGMLVRGQ